MVMCGDDERWTYRGVECEIEWDWDDSNRWTYKRATLPDGTRIPLSLSNHDHSPRSLERAVDAFLDGQGR